VKPGAQRESNEELNDLREGGEVKLFIYKYLSKGGKRCSKPEFMER
jgi:hypothetical protein